MTQPPVDPNKKKSVPARAGSRDVAPRIHASAIEFQSDAEEIAQRPVPFAARAVLYIILAIIIFAVIWASVGHIDRVITATGKVTTSAPQIVIGPFETSIIRSINVHIGDAVKKDDVLATLDPTFAEADTSAVKTRVAALQAQTTRLQAELIGKNLSRFSDNDDLEELNRRIDHTRRAYVASELETFDAQMREFGDQMNSRAREIEDVKTQIESAQRIENARAELYRRHVGSLLQLLEATNTRVGMERDLHKLQNGQNEFRGQIATVKKKRDSFVADWRNKAAEELKTAQQELDKLNQDLRKSEKRSALVELRAPSDAVVLNMAGRSIGSVMREAETLMTLVPTNTPLEISVELEPKDVARVRADDKVTIKLDALPFQQHGVIEGTLKTVSDDTIERANGASTGRPVTEDGKPATPTTYRAIVKIGEMKLTRIPDDFRLIPGMGVKAEIKVGQRRVIDYFLDPLTKALGESLREP